MIKTCSKVLVGMHMLVSNAIAYMICKWGKGGVLSVVFALLNVLKWSPLHFHLILHILPVLSSFEVKGCFLFLLLIILIKGYYFILTYFINDFTEPCVI